MFFLFQEIIIPEPVSKRAMGDHVQITFSFFVNSEWVWPGVGGGDVYFQVLKSC